MKLVHATAIAALMMSTTAQAVSVTAVSGTITTQRPLTRMVNGPQGCLWVGLQGQDRNNPEYIANAQAGQPPPNYPFATVGSGCPQRINYTSNLGSNWPSDATTGPDGAVWFAVGGMIGRATQSGTTSVFPVGSDGLGVTAVAAGVDGNIWYARGGNFIGKMTTSGQTTEYNIGTQILQGQMVGASDGGVWATGVIRADGSSTLMKVAANGTVTKFPKISVPGTNGLHVIPGVMTIGGDGALWFAAGTGIAASGAFNQISVVGKITATGAVSSWTIDGNIDAMTAGPDGNVWFTVKRSSFGAPDSTGSPRNVHTGLIARIDTNGTVTEYEAFSWDTVTHVGGAWTDITMPGIGAAADGKIYAMRFNRNANYGGNGTSQAPYVPMETDFYALTPDPAAVPSPTLSVLTAGNGTGSVRMSVGINATSSQQLVTLTAVPSGNSTFTGWSDPTCTATSLTCQVTVIGAKTVTAMFTVPQQAVSTNYQGAVYAAGPQQSYLRIFAVHGGTVDVNLIDPRTGQNTGTPKQVTVADNGFVQVGIADLAPSPSADNPSYYSVSAQAGGQFSGYLQHVTWNPQAGVISNLTACGVPAPLPSLSFVDSSMVGTYPSSIILTNTTTQSIGSVTLDLLDSNGNQLAKYQSDSIAPKASKVLPIVTIESGSGVRSSSPNVGQFVIKLETPFAGTIQHWINNNQASGVLTDQTMACPLSAQ